MNKENNRKVEPLWKPEKVAEVLGISRRTVLSWARDGRLPTVRVGRFYRFKPAEVQHWMSNKSNR